MTNIGNILSQLEGKYDKEKYNITYLGEKEHKYYCHIHLKNKPKYSGIGIIYEIDNIKNETNKMNLNFIDTMTILNDFRDSGLKVLFLDIDGVLNSDNFFNNRQNNDKIKSLPYPLDEIDPKCVERLNNIIDKTKANIVISSDWRFQEELPIILSQAGLKYPIYDTTPYLFGNRGKEIEKWMKDKNISNYVIIDDNDINWFSKEQHKHFVHTKYEFGLTDKDMYKAIHILNKN